MAMDREVQAVPGCGSVVSVRAAWVENGATRRLDASGRLDGLVRAGREMFWCFDGGKLFVAASRVVFMAADDANVHVHPITETPTPRSTTEDPDHA